MPVKSPLPCCLVLLLLSLSAHGASAPKITHGVSSGDVTASSAVIWSRGDQLATMNVRVQPATASATDARVVSIAAVQDTDFTARVTLDGLSPDTIYRYDVWFEAEGSRSEHASGLFRTAPAPDQDRPVSLIWSGDLGGQRYCRQLEGGYRIFKPMAEFRADFFVANGDMIYADNDCPENGIEPGWRNVAASFPGIADPSVDWMDPAAVRKVFDAHWRYNREDPLFQTFLASTPTYSQWDDHEVINDFGGPWSDYPPQGERHGYPNVVAAGLASFFDYHPIERQQDDPDRIYRSYRWGKHLELFILDARSYRSRNTDPDTADKTMLGASQLAWLQQAISRSSATWKIISSNVPLSVATGSGADRFGRDAFANGAGSARPDDLATASGFETELLTLLQRLDSLDVKNLVFISTDVHFAAQLRYEKDFDNDGEPLLFHEFLSGPLSAIRSPSPPAFDPTLNPVVLYAEGGIFNYGTVRITTDGAPVLTTDIRDQSGRIRPGSQLVLSPRE